MRKTLLFLIAIMLCSLSVDAQNNRPDKKQWLEEMRQLRVNFIAKNLQLTKEQRDKFVPAYESMSRELEKVMGETHQLYRTVKKKGAAASEIEKEKAAEAMYECKGKENQIEMKYFIKFKTILTSDQLLNLKATEHRFNKRLMKQRRRNNTK